MKNTVMKLEVVGPKPRGRPRAAVPVQLPDEEEEISEDDDEEEPDRSLLSVDVATRIKETGIIAVVESGDGMDNYYSLIMGCMS